MSIRIPERLADFYNTFRAHLANEEAPPPVHIQRILKPVKDKAQAIFRENKLGIDVAYIKDDKGKWSLGFYGSLEVSQLEKFASVVEEIKDKTGYDSFSYESNVVAVQPHVAVRATIF